MLYAVYNLATGELDYVCDEEGRVNFDPKVFGSVECPSRTWRETHDWDWQARVFNELPPQD
jgi:hypothetical protein